MSKEYLDDDVFNNLRDELKSAVTHNDASDRTFHSVSAVNEADMDRFRQLTSAQQLDAIQRLQSVAYKANLLISYMEYVGSEAITKRRKDHWDILKEKCESDPMFKEQWNELMILLRLEQD